MLWKKHLTEFQAVQNETWLRSADIWYWYVVYATADSRCRIVVRGRRRRSAEPEDDLQEAGRLVAEMSGQ